MTELHKGKFLYGAVKCGERGQIVIPKEARKHFNIKPGDQIMVLGDLNKGIAVGKPETMKKLGIDSSEVKELDKGKYFYGITKMAESGQIVIPKEARAHFNIKPGDKLIVLGYIKKGIVIQKASILKDLALKILGAVNGFKTSSKKSN